MDPDLVQDMIESAGEILMRLRADGAFMDLVGEYDFGSGLKDTALAVLAGNETIPGVKKVNGLEVIIGRVPDTTSRAVIAGCSVRIKKWKLYLITYEGGDPDDGLQAADRLCDLCPGAEYTSVGGGSKQSDIAGIDQIVVKIPGLAPWVDPNELEGTHWPPITWSGDIDGLKAEDKTGDGGNYSTGQGEANNDYSADGGAI